MRFDLDPYKPDWRIYLHRFTWGRDLRYDRNGHHPMYWILRLPYRWRLSYEMSGHDNQRFGRLFLYRRNLSKIEAMLLVVREERRKQRRRNLTEPSDKP